MKKYATGISLLVAALLFVSCASVPYNQNRGDVLRLVELINAGKVSGVKGLTPAPFVLDTETLYLESDIDTLWKNLKNASFAMSKANFVSAEHIGSESYKVFADTFDMKNFFAKYTDKDTSIATVETGEGKYFLLLERKVSGYPRIRGLKGPVK